MSSLELAGLNNFGSLWVIGMISTCLVAGPGMIKAEEYCFPASKRVLGTHIPSVTELCKPGQVNHLPGL